jgi:hypothetical protein
LIQLKNHQHQHHKIIIYMANLSENIFQRFRRPGPTYTSDTIIGGKLSKTFDEPTYLTFRVGFSSMNTAVDMTNYDKMPHPLFELYQEDSMEARNYYSTIQYLRDCNEFTRAQMLIDFITKWNDLQNNYQWYFQGISGLDSILKIDPKRGMRVPGEGKVSLSMLEGLDLRITHLLNEYRKIAWDDVYQRWILPDMMRYFAMDIYVTEFRIFHQSNIVNSGSKFSGSEVPNLVLTAMDDLMPTYIIHCERCEFDITSFGSHLSEFSSTDANMAEIAFDINVGNITEEYRNTLLDYFWSDRIINGPDRTKELLAAAGDQVPSPGIGLGTNTETIQQDIPYNPTQLSANTNYIPYINPDIDYGEKKSHESAKPFIETGGSGQSNINNAGAAGTGSTWVGNALKFGKAFVQNTVEGVVDKAKLSKIPGLGISFNEAIAAIQSKNVFTVFGAIRQAITQSIQNTTPSQNLDNKVIDKTFREFLIGISKSQATTKEGIQLVAAANEVLNNQGIWEHLKDFSKATDLVATALGEINTSLPVVNPNTLKNNVIQLIGGEHSLATDSEIKKSGTIIFEGVPTSFATSSSSKIGGNKIERPLAGATSGSIEKPSFAGSTPNSGIEGGKVEEPAAGVATNNATQLQKADFSSTNNQNGLQSSSLPRPEPGQAENGKNKL